MTALSVPLTTLAILKVSPWGTDVDCRAGLRHIVEFDRAHHVRLVTPDPALVGEDEEVRRHLDGPASNMLTPRCSGDSMVVSVFDPLSTADASGKRSMIS